MYAGFYNTAPSRPRRVAGVALAAAIVAAGCRAPQPKNPYADLRISAAASTPQQPAPTIDPTTFKTHDDIYQIVPLWVPPVWLEDPPGQAVGFKARVYFSSSSHKKAVFVSGPITVSMSRLVRRLGRGFDRHVVYEWKLDEREALGYRVTKEAIGGLSYGFMLRWPPEVDVYGKAIEIVFSYTRGDGRVVRSGPKRLLVPLPSGFAETARR